MYSSTVLGLIFKDITKSYINTASFWGMMITRALILNFLDSQHEMEKVCIRSLKTLKNIVIV